MLCPPATRVSKCHFSREHRTRRLVVSRTAIYCPLDCVDVLIRYILERIPPDA